MPRETKFKKGESVKFVKEVYDCTENKFTLGKFYTILYVDTFGACHIENDNGDEWCIEEGAFQKKKKKLKTEVDFLNAFKENFRDGV